MALTLVSLTVVLEESVRKDWFASFLIVTLTWVFFISFFATLLATIFGYGLYDSIFMLPYVLASVQKIDAQQIGLIIMWQGIPEIAILSFIPFFVKNFMNPNLTHDWAKDLFFCSQIVRESTKVRALQEAKSLWQSYGFNSFSLQWPQP